MRIYTKNQTLINIILFLLIAILSTFSAISVFRYLSLSSTLFYYGFAILILVNLLLLVLINIFKGHRILSTIMSFMLVVILGGSIYVLFTILQINSVVNEVIIEGDSIEEVSTSFVTYNNNSITTLDQIKGKRFGFVENVNVQEGNLLAIEELSDKKIDVTFVKYDTYNDMLLGLFSKEIDVAPLPKEYYSMFISNDGYEEHLEKTKVIHEFSTKIKIEGTDAVKKDLSKEPFSILLMGNDGGRTDTLIFVSFNPKTMVATLTSIARDSYVPIACYKNQASDKINHSRQISRQCTLDTVSNLLGEQVDYFVEVNFKAVVDIVDSLGKLWIVSPIEFVGQDSSDDRGHFTVWINKGGQFMSGEQVLAFSRERKNMPGGDLQRQLNQQQVITALLGKLLETRDINMFVNALKSAGSNVKTNLSISEMTGLANYVVNEMSSSVIDNKYFVQMVSSRISGYFSWAYNDSLQLPLSIYKPYQGSINDAQSLINQNMMKDYKTNNDSKFSFNIFTPYYGISYIKDWYDEREIHEPLPDFMPSMVNNGDPWLLSKVKTWAQTRNWIKLNVVEIWENNPEHNQNLLYNQVISQSVRYGIKTANISELTVKVIKHELDCRIEINRSDEQCKSIVPNFANMRVTDIIQWNQANGDILNLKYIDETSPDYNLNKVNQVISQSVEAYTKLKNVTTKIEVVIVDYPKVIVPVSDIFSKKWTKADVEDWISKTPKLLVVPMFVYAEEFSATAPVDQVVEVMIQNIGSEPTKLNDNTTIKGNVQLVFALSKGLKTPEIPTTPMTP